jgi:KDO2-lipid IV(A) lauroyltransferase
MSLKFIRNTLLFLFAKLAFDLALVLPRSLGLWLFGTIGRISFLFPNREKTNTLNHLRFIFGGSWNENKIRKTGRGVYSALGKNMFDAVKLSRSSERTFNAIVKYDDLGRFKKAFDQGRGVFVITAHVGCFEMLLHFFARHGFKSFAIGRKSLDPRLDGLIRAIRSGKDIDYMDRDDSARKVVRYLKEGRAFGVLIDQDILVEGIFGTFLGKTAFTASGPIKLAMRLKVPAFVVTTDRQSDNTHHVYFSRQLEFRDTGDEMTDLKAAIQTANDLICETIRKFPEQWVWMHRRWRQQPPAT